MRVTLKDLAKETGYSVTTVSRALTGYDDVSASTRAIILDAAERLGYQPNLLARQLQSSRTDTLSLILPAYGPRFADAFFSEFLAGVGTEANAHSYDLLLSTQVSESGALATYKRVVGGSRIDGMMVLRTRQHDSRIQYLHETGLPFVTYGRSETQFPFSYVDADGELGLRLVTEHFIKLGHQRIAFVSAMSDLMFTKHRLLGYQQTLEANRLPFDPELVAYGDLTQQSGLVCGEQLLQLESPPTAIIAANDLMALGVFSAIRQVGLRVGDDIAVSGYDDTPLAAHADPPLTSVDCHVFESGQHVCRLLIKIIQDETRVGEHILLKPALVVRKSSGPARR